MNIQRGDVWYVESGYTTGSEQRPGRPAVIVSNERNNEHSSTVEVVYFTTQPKHNLPTHAVVKSLNRESTAICEQITTVSVERLGTYWGRITDDEMKAIDAAMLVSLDLKPQKETVRTEASETAESKLAEAEFKCAILQQLYDTLLDKLVKAN